MSKKNVSPSKINKKLSKEELKILIEDCVSCRNKYSKCLEKEKIDTQIKELKEKLERLN